MAVNLEGRNYVSVKDFSTEGIWQTLQTAERLKLAHYRGDDRPLLAGKTLAMIFQKPSLRTRVSFETGMTRLGGHAIYLAPGDIAIVVSRFADLIMARTFGHEIVVDLAKHATCPVLNGLSDHEHPCQIMADLLTVYERKRRLEGLNLAYLGDGNNVAHSLMYGGALTGMNTTVCTAPGFEPDAAVTEDSQEISRATGAKVAVTNDLSTAAKDADVLYTDVWASMGQESEAEKRRQLFQPYQINAGVMKLAKPDAIILHCLPAHYGEEIDYETSRLPNSVIFDQAENRLHVQRALLKKLMS